MSTIRADGDAAINPPGPDEEMTRETVTLLLDELARLEAELRARDEAAPVPDAWPTDRSAAEDADAELRRKVEELTAELAGRDETIGVLLEQTQLFEEAAAAQRDEWEQLTRWVEEVEQRVGERGPDDGKQAEECAAAQRRSEEQTRRHETERTAWEAQKRRLVQELEALRGAGGPSREGPRGRGPPAPRPRRPWSTTPRPRPSSTPCGAGSPRPTTRSPGSVTSSARNATTTRGRRTRPRLRSPP